MKIKDTFKKVSSFILTFIMLISSGILTTQNVVRAESETVTIYRNNNGTSTSPMFLTRSEWYAMCVDALLQSPVPSGGSKTFNLSNTEAENNAVIKKVLYFMATPEGYDKFSEVAKTDSDSWRWSGSQNPWQYEYGQVDSLEKYDGSGIYGVASNAKLGTNIDQRSYRYHMAHFYISQYRGNQNIYFTSAMESIKRIVQKLPQVPSNFEVRFVSNTTLGGSSNTQNKMIWRLKKESPTFNMAFYKQDENGKNIEQSSAEFVLKYWNGSAYVPFTDFEPYGTNAGTYRYKKGANREGGKFYTGLPNATDGRAYFTGFPIEDLHGSFIVEEVAPPRGYQKLNGNIQSSKVLYEDFKAAKNGQTFTRTIENNKLITPSLKLVKKSANPEYVLNNPNYSLIGAEYGIYNTSVDAEFDDNRRFTFKVEYENGNTNIWKEPLYEGIYFVREIKAPKGYQLDQKIYTVKITNEELNTFEVSDKPDGDPLTLMLTKENEKGIRLKDAEYEVKYFEQIEENLEEVKKLTPKYTWRFKTGERGTFWLQEYSEEMGGRISGDELPKLDGAVYLPYGTLLIKEVKAPLGYQLDPKEYVRTLTQGNVASVSTYNAPLVIEQSQKMRFSLQKLDVEENSNMDLSGAEFVLRVVDIPTGQTNVKVGDVVKTIVTNKDGKVESGDLEVATYDIVEIKAPNGYQINPIAIRVKGEFENNGKKYTTKVTQESTNKKEISTLLDEKVKELESLGKNVDIKVNVNDGNISNSSDNPIIYTYDLKDYGRFTIHKVENNEIENSSQNKENIDEKDIEFDIFDESGNLVETIKTNDKGYAYSSYYRKGQNLVVKQKTQRSDYIEVEDFNVVIGENFENQVFELENIIITRPLQILKKDKETGKLIAKEGVLFELYESDKITKVEHFDEEGNIIPFETNSEGIIDIPKELKLGTYFLKEIKAPKGYFLDPNSEPIEINITEEMNQVIVEVENVPQKGELILEKKGLVLVDVKEEEGIVKPIFEERLLKDTKWQLVAREDIHSSDDNSIKYHKDEIVEEIITKEDEVSKIENILHGKYYLKEVSTPKSYLLDKNIYEIEFTPQNQNIEVESKAIKAVNERKNIKFEVEKEFEMSENFTKNPKAEFGLFLEEDYTENGITIKKDSMLDKIVVDSLDGIDKEIEIEVPKIIEEEKEIKRYEISTYEEIEVDDKDRPIIENEEVIGYEKKVERNLVDVFKIKEKEEYDTKINELENQNIIYEVKEIKETIKVPVETIEKEIKKIVSRVVKGEFSNQLIDGKFYVKELSTDKDYILDENNHEVEFDFSETTEKTTTKVTPVKNDLQKVSVKIVKVEMGSNKEIPVEGARYKLVSKDSEKGEMTIGEYVTDKDGIILIEDLENGNYYIKEVLSPEGYFKNEEKIELDLTDKKDGEVVEQIVENEKIPQIKTTAKDNKTEKKNINPTSLVEIVDTVKYRDLVVGEEYELEGTLMDKSTNAPLLDKDGLLIKRILTFIPQTRNGKIDLIFEIDASLLREKEVVVFENLFRQGKEVAIHNDINDKDQTVRFTNPKIKTRFMSVNGEKEVNPTGEITFIDYVRYEDLVKGEKYTLKLTLFNKTTNELLKDESGNVLSVEKVFIAENEESEIPVEITLNTLNLKGQEIVAFEELIYEGEVIAEHKDQNDKDQTIRVTNPQNPRTGDMGIINYTMVGLLSLGGLVVTKKKKEDM